MGDTGEARPSYSKSSCHWHMVHERSLFPLGKRDTRDVCKPCYKTPYHWQKTCERASGTWHTRDPGSGDRHEHTNHN